MHCASVPELIKFNLIRIVTFASDINYCKESYPAEAFRHTFWEVKKLFSTFPEIKHGLKYAVIRYIAVC